MFSRRFLFSALVLLGLLYLATSIPLIAHAAASDDFVITVNTNITGSSGNTQFTIPTTGSGYNYNVDCNNDGTNEVTAQTGNYTCNYGSAGTYTIRIKDNSGAKTGFPRIFFNDGGDAPKLVTIDQWGTGKWTLMNRAFAGCPYLNGSASDSPDLSNVTDMSEMFLNASWFNGNIGSWNTAHVTNMSGMFKDARAFNQNIGSWNTAHMTDMSYMFYDAFAFNQNIGSWNTANVTNLSHMFAFDYAFNQNIGSWNTANVTNMSYMFGDAPFNQDISSWNTAQVTDMSLMFYLAGAFNQNIGGWNTAKVTDMRDMFYDAYSFNQDISSWNTANVTNMSEMFDLAVLFNQNIGGWNTAQVTDMSHMFADARAFNQNIGGWNTSHVTDMNNMFNYALAFNQNLGTWKVRALTNADGMFTSIGLSTANYDALLKGWNAQTLHTGVNFDGGTSQYCTGAAARKHMVNTDHWSITDGGKSCADLQVAKKVKKLNPNSHKYTLTVKNLGPDPALNATVTDPLPRHYVISQVNSKTANCVGSGRTVTCTLAQMTPGTTFQVTIHAAPNGATGQNCAKVKSDTIDPNSTNNKACVAVPQ